MRKLIVILAVAVLSVFGVVSTASASEWNQLFQQSSTEQYGGHNVGSFDQMQMFWQADDTFATPTFTGFTDPSWQNFTVSGTEAYALGSDSNYMQFYLNFNDDTPATPHAMQFLYQASLNGQMVQRQILSYTATNWWTWPEYTGTDQEWHDLGGGDPVAVPEPSSLALLLTGCAGLVATRVRRK